MHSKLGLFLIAFSSVVLLASCDVGFEELIRAVPYETACDPDADCSNSQPGDFVPDPLDCHSYYYCISVGGEVVPSDVLLTCPAGQFFNSSTLKCEDEVVPCINECRSSCSSTCAEAFDIVGYPGDCTKYYVCLLGGDELLVDCPEETPYFDGANCTTNPATCCDYCTPYCQTGGIEIADPYNCRMFYLCFSEGVPLESSHFSCSSGEIFDTVTGSCVEGITCNPICAGGFTSSVYL